MVLRKRIGIFFGICCSLAVMVAVMAGIQRKGQEQSALAEKEKRTASSKVSSETSEELYRMLLDEVEKYAGKEVITVKPARNSMGFVITSMRYYRAGK